MSKIPLPEIKENNEKDDILKFTLSNTNVSIANALRRTIMADLKTIVFDTTKDSNIKIYRNTTKFNNDILKQRLGCIPIHINDITQNMDNLVMELNETNKTDNIRYITTQHFKIKNKETGKYLSDKDRDQIFPPTILKNKNISKAENESYWTIFTRLMPKLTNEIPAQEIHLECEFSVKSAKDNGMFNVACTCGYGNTEDKIKQREAWKDIESKYKKEGMEEGNIEYKKQNWYNHDAKRIYKKDSFNFILESVGVYSNVELISNAVDVIVKKLKNIYSKVEQDGIEINPSDNTIDDCYDIILENHDYTIGKVIEYVLHYQYLDTRKAQLSYAGFIKKHPHDNYSVVRLAFKSNHSNENEEVNMKNALILVQNACKICIGVFNKIGEHFNANK